MGSFREAMKMTCDTLRTIAGPSALDVIADQLTIRTRTWTGGTTGRIGDGTPNDVDLIIPQIYKIQQVSTREIAGSGGRYEVGDIKVGPITPAYSIGGKSGGFTVLQLNPTVTNDLTEIIYIIAGTHSGEYQLLEERSWRRYRYELVLRRRRSTP